MRMLEPRLLLDAAGGDELVTALVAGAHGDLAEAYFDKDPSQRNSEGIAWNTAVQAVEQTPPYIPEYSRDSQQDRVEIAFIASDIEDIQVLSASLSPHVEVVLLDSGADGMAQMADVLADRVNIDAVHIFSHGTAGSLSLGETDLTTQTMVSQYAAELRTIGQALTEAGDILIYGCDFASGEVGREAADTLARMTGADVAASTDLTGHADLGGDWELEVQTGHIDGRVLAAGTNWFSTLAPQTLVSHETPIGDIDHDEAVASDRSVGQTFTYDSGSATYEVDQIDLVLQQDDGEPVQNIFVSIRETFTGPDIATGTISSAALNDEYEWHSFALGSTAVLNSNQTYYIVVSTDLGPPRSVEVGVEHDGIYADGAYIRPNGTPKGSDDVLFRVINNNANSDPVITSNGGGPVAFIDMDENQTLATTVVATDPDLPTDTLTYSIIGGFDQAQFTIDPVSGELRFITPPDFENPTDNFPTNGIYTVLVEVTDSQGATDSQSISVTVRDVNEAPVAAADTFTVVEDGSVSIDVLANDNDPEGDTLTITEVDGQAVIDGGPAVSVANGTVQLLAGELVFRPTANYSGPGSFTYRVSDGNGEISSGTVSGTVTSVNDPPVATDNVYTTSEGTSVNGNAITGDTGSGVDSDIDGDPLTLDAGSVGTFTTTQGGTITLTVNGSFIYTPAVNFNGSDSFVYSVTDGALSDTATLTFTVIPSNNNPVAAADSFIVPEDSSVSVDALANDSDADGDMLTITSVNGQPITDGGPAVSVSNGAVQLLAGELIFTPDLNYNGPADFTYEISDGNGLFATGTVSGLVNAANDAPTASGNGYTTAEDTTVSGNVLNDDSGAGLDTDPDGDALSLDGSSVGTFTTAQGGTITLTPNGDFTYMPPADFTGIDTFIYTVTDGVLADSANVTFDVSQGTAPVVTPPTLPDTDPPTLPDREEPAEETEGPLPDPVVSPVSDGTSSTAPSPANAPKLVLPQPKEPPVTFVAPESEPIVEIPDVVQSQPVEITAPPSDRTQPAGYDLRPINYDVFEGHLNKTGEELRQYDGLLETTTAKVTFAFGALLGAGSVSWLLQSGILAATLLSALPAWKRFDPIAIVSGRRDEGDEDAASDVEIMMQKIRDVGARVPREQVR